MSAGAVFSSGRSSVSRDGSGRFCPNCILAAIMSVRLLFTPSVVHERV